MDHRRIDSFIEAEQHARLLTRRYVVVECRAEHDPPGVESHFVVAREDQVDEVPDRREVVFIAEFDQPLALEYRLVADNLLMRLREALREGGPATGVAWRETVRSIRDQLVGDLAAVSERGRK